MTHTFKLAVSHAEGVLVRVLGLSMRRGYELIEITAVPALQPGVIDLHMRLESERPAGPLARQLSKLRDVRQVEVLP